MIQKSQSCPEVRTTRTTYTVTIGEKAAEKRNRSLRQVVRKLRGLVRRLKAELQAKIDEMRAKTSVLNTPKRERAVRKATERGVESLAGGYRCALLRNIGHAGADAVVAHLDAGIARQTVCRWEQLLGANVLAHARAFSQLHAARPVEVRDPSRAGWTWEVHALRGDATNSNILQGSNAHVCDVTRLFHHALDTDDVGASGDTTGPSTARTAT